MEDLNRFESLVALMDRLRGPDGCPWDREQTYATLRGYLLEECFEVAEALDGDQPEEICEELGDLLFQIVFLSCIAKEEGKFTVDDVIAGISSKMIRRHPHVFGDDSADTSGEVLKKWEEIKRQEKSDRGVSPATSLLDGVPQGLPALLKANRLGTKAARVGFDWERPESALEKVDEELGELRQALKSGDPAAAREEIGDLLFAVVNVARKLDIEPEGALSGTNLKFTRRFGWIEQELVRRDIPIASAGLELLEELWQQAKSQST
jgi:tetrapyrrole methylase family protein/MazG family protein